MKALTLTQPWATLVALGAKTVETRSWRTNYRGILAIHAAKGFPISARELCTESPFCEALSGVGYGLPRGFIIAICRLDICVPTDACFIGERTAGPDAQGSFSITSQEHSFGDYSPLRWAWILKEVRVLPEPVAAKGALGLWEWYEN